MSLSPHTHSVRWIFLSLAFYRKESGGGTEGEEGAQAPPGKRRAGWSQGQDFQIQMQSEVVFSEEIETDGCGSGYTTVCQNIELYTKKGSCTVHEKGE